MSVQANFADIYLRGMRDRSMRSGTELAREIQLTDWSTAGEQGKLVFVVSTTPSLAQFTSFFRDRSFITSQVGAGGGGRWFLKKCSVSKLNPPKNFEVKIIPPSQFLFEKRTPPLS